jgi:hypothetical protein
MLAASGKSSLQKTCNYKEAEGNSEANLSIPTGSLSE